MDKKLPDEQNFSLWLSEVVSRFKNLECDDRNTLLETLISHCEPPQLSMLTEHLPDLLYRDFISQLPLELAEKIANNLDCQQLFVCCQVSNTWNSRITSFRSIWYSRAEEMGVNVAAISTAIQANLPTDPQPDHDDIQQTGNCGNSSALIFKETCFRALKFLSGLSACGEGQSIETVTENLEEPRDDEYPFLTKKPLLYYISDEIFVNGTPEISIWSMPDKAHLSTITQDDGRIVSVLQYKDPFILFNTTTASVLCFDVRTGSKVFQLIGHTWFVSAADFHNSLAVTTCTSVMIWDYRDLQDPVQVATVPNPLELPIRQIRMLPNKTERYVSYIGHDSKNMLIATIDLETEDEIQNKKILLDCDVWVVEESEIASWSLDRLSSGIIYLTYWHFKNKTSCLAICSFEEDPFAVNLVKCVPLPQERGKAAILGAGSRFIVTQCSILKEDFSLFDLTTDSYLITVSTNLPSTMSLGINSCLPYTVYQMALCDKEWLDGFVFDEMSPDKLVFIVIQPYRTVLHFGAWNAKLQKSISN